MVGAATRAVSGEIIGVYHLTIVENRLVEIAFGLPGDYTVSKNV